MGWGRAGETATGVVWVRGFGAERIGGRGAGRRSTDDRGDCARDVEPKTAAEVAPVKKGDSRVNGGGGGLGREGNEGGCGLTYGGGGLGGPWRG